MPISRRTLLATLAAAPLASVMSRPAFAAYPDKPIRLVVPFAAGGNADLVGRLMGEGISKALGQPVIVENRTGAGGSIGAAAVATAAPDGYTLLGGSNGPLTVNPFVQAKLSYHPLEDFVAIGLANLAPHAIVLHDSVKVKNVAELVALSKEKQITLATSGVGSATHLTLARFNAATGAKLVHVPYRGGGALIPDVLAGNVSGAMTEMSTLLEHHNKGKVRILAVAWTKRSVRAPDVPTMIESGVKNFTASSFVGLVAASKTPPAIVATLEKALIATLAEKSTQDKFIASGAELVPPDLQTSKGFAAYIKKDYEESKEAVKIAGLKPQ
jgi:tripartite-type tricarboxylate transporter receptor subunit TctC